MVKIGFIDYYLDEWHANNYPAWIEEESRGEMKVASAYGQIDSPLGGRTNEQWCRDYGIQECGSIPELIRQSDVLIVLSPDNCEKHEELSREALSSGKLTYVDKTFAPDIAAAKRIFAVAQEHGTPCYSTSALRFAEEYQDIDRTKIKAIECWGAGRFDTYSIHQLEPLMMLMGCPAKRVQYLQGDNWYTCLIEMEDGRFGSISGYAEGSPFVTHLCMSGSNRLIEVKSDFFRAFIRELIEFFRTGQAQVPREDTLRIMAVRTAALEAARTPGVWVAVPEI